MKRTGIFLLVVAFLGIASAVTAQERMAVGFRVAVSDGRLTEIEKACEITITEVFWVIPPVYRALVRTGQTVQGAKDCLLQLQEIESVSRE